MIKREYEEASLADSFASFQNSVVDVNNRLVDVLEGSKANDVWIKQAQFCQAMGNTALAMQYMRKFEMDEMGAQKKKVHVDADNGSDIIHDVQVLNTGKAVDDDEIQIDQFPGIDEDDPFNKNKYGG